MSAAARKLPISVVICSRNPRGDYLGRVLEALRGQTLSRDAWELLLIDNGSEVPLAERFDLAWHAAGRHVREEEMGLTPARLRGIAEARGRLLVFVDDDNVLDPTYLEQTERILRTHPNLGAFGGAVVGEFETEPGPWVEPYLGNLAIRDVLEPRWGNDPADRRTIPFGAGLCIQHQVAEEYGRQIASDPVRRKLDRSGASLASSGDTDMALTSCDLGLGMGNFPELRVRHLIPTGRLQEDYLLRLEHGITRSMIILRHIRYGYTPAMPDPIRVWVRRLSLHLTKGRRAAAFYLANREATREALLTVRELAR